MKIEIELHADDLMPEEAFYTVKMYVGSNVINNVTFSSDFDEAIAVAKKMQKEYGRKKKI